MGLEHGYGYGYNKIGNFNTIGFSTTRWVLTPLITPFPGVTYQWFDTNPPGVWRDVQYWKD